LKLQATRDSAQLGFVGRNQVIAPKFGKLHPVLNRAQGLVVIAENLSVMTTNQSSVTEGSKRGQGVWNSNTLICDAVNQLE
jgi:hypothetical protein